MMWGYNDHMSGWSWALMGVGMVLFWAVLITGVVLLVRYFDDAKREPRKDRDTAAEILARRFASGEITEEEFASKARVLNG